MGVGDAAGADLGDGDGEGDKLAAGVGCRDETGVAVGCDVCPRNPERARIVIKKPTARAAIIFPYPGVSILFISVL
jgi:hypothetical protein